MTRTLALGEFVDPAADPDRRYTTPLLMERCKALAKVDAFDVDVAADSESAQAPRWFVAPDAGDVEKMLAAGVDGLAQRWSERVWCNPKYSDIGPWVVKAWSAIADCAVIAMLLPADRTQQAWWQELVESVRDGRCPPRNHRLYLVAKTGTLTTHFMAGRQKFGHPGNPRAVGVGCPRFNSVLLVWRPT